jgi:hypothetical protein
MVKMIMKMLGCLMLLATLSGCHYFVHSFHYSSAYHYKRPHHHGYHHRSHYDRHHHHRRY